MRENSADYMADLLRGNTESLLLSLIEALDGTYGYQLIKEVEKRSRGFFRFKEGTVYPALRKLENEGLIWGEWQKMSTGHQRRFYRITPRGKEVLSRKIAVWQGFTSAVALILRPARP